MSFGGNPYKTITAIDTSGGIVCSRTTGQTPAFFQFSARAITATGTDKPFRDLEFSWDMGDPAGTESLWNPVTGRYINPNSEIVGPKARYVYRSAGTYTVTLTIRGKNGSGFTTAQVTQDVVVSAYNASGGHWYFDSNFVGVSDGTIGAPFTTLAQLYVKGIIPNAALHIKRASRWSGTDGIGIDVAGTPLRIDAYGSASDPKPIFEITSGSNSAFFIWNGGSSSPRPRDDLVISNIEFRRAGTATSAIVYVAGKSHASATVKNIYLDNCDVISAATVGLGNRQYWVIMESRPGSVNVGIWGGSISADPGDASAGTGIFCQVDAWAFFAGFPISGAGYNNTLDHHIYPHIQENTDYDCIDFGSGPGRNYCINASWSHVSGGLEVAQYMSTANCNLFGTLRAFDASATGLDITDTVFDNYVVQNCAFNGLTAVDGVILFYCGRGVTLRNSIVWNCNGGPFWTPRGESTAVYDVYGLKVYSTSAVGVFDWKTCGALSNAQTFADNIVYIANATAVLAVLHSFSSFVSNGSLIDFNQYWIPNDADQKAWYDSATAKTFAQWQASGFDVNGLIADPNWIDPANGNFNTFTPVNFNNPSGSPYLNPITTTSLRHRNFLVPTGYPQAKTNLVSPYGHRANQRLGSTFRSGSSAAHRIGAGTKLPPRRK